MTAVDIAPFGRVMSWDPKKKTGTSASRIEEFPRADLVPGHEVLPGSDGRLLVPRWNGPGCIGLQWFENRLLRQASLEFADETSMSIANAIELKPGPVNPPGKGVGCPSRRGPSGPARAIWGIAWREWPTGTQKIRWIFAGSLGPIHVKAVSGIHAVWRGTASICESRQPGSGRPARCRSSCTTVFSMTCPGSHSHHRQWDPSRALSVRLMASLTGDYKADRTVLRFGQPAPGVCRRHRRRAHSRQCLLRGLSNHGQLEADANRSRLDLDARALAHPRVVSSPIRPSNGPLPWCTIRCRTWDR